jgi:hypothetical protein
VVLETGEASGRSIAHYDLGWFYQFAVSEEKKVGYDDEIRDDSDVHHGAIDADGPDQKKFDEDEVWNNCDP